MILADTSVWIDHFRGTITRLRDLLEADQILMHPFVLGEIALGVVRHRTETLRDMAKLATVLPARHAEVLEFIERHQLFGAGIGLVDVHLLVAARLRPETRLWTRDGRLRAAAERVFLALEPDEG